MSTYTDHNPDEPEGRAAGGRARASALSPERKSEIAKLGAASRWEELPEVIAGAPENPMVLGDVEIECYVLDNGTRVITQSAFLRALGRARTIRRTSTDDNGIPAFLQGRALLPYITDDLIEHAKPTTFRASGGRAHGYNAELLPDVCRVFLAARRDGVLPTNQKPIAAQAELLVLGLAHVGITALVDEATGYQDIRERDALAKIFERFIAKEIQPYLTTFPPEFYKQMFRLRNIPYSADAGQRRPQYFGKFTNDIIYSRLAPGVLDELKRVQEKTPAGYPRHKLFQKLTANHGYMKLREHLGSVMALMTFSDNWDEFKARLEVLHPQFTDQLAFDLEMPDPGKNHRI